MELRDGQMQRSEHAGEYHPFRMLIVDCQFERFNFTQVFVIIQREHDCYNLSFLVFLLNEFQQKTWNVNNQAFYSGVKVYPFEIRYRFLPFRLGNKCTK